MHFGQLTSYVRNGKWNGFQGLLTFIEHYWKTTANFTHWYGFHFFRRICVLTSEKKNPCIGKGINSWWDPLIHWKSMNCDTYQNFFRRRKSIPMFPSAIGKSLAWDHLDPFLSLGSVSNGRSTHPRYPLQQTYPANHCWCLAVSGLMVGNEWVTYDGSQKCAMGNF